MSMLLIVPGGARPPECLDEASRWLAHGTAGSTRPSTDLLGVWRRDPLDHELPTVDPVSGTTPAPVAVSHSLDVLGRWTLVWLTGTALGGHLDRRARRQAVLEHLVAPLDERADGQPSFLPVLEHDEQDPGGHQPTLRRPRAGLVGESLPHPPRLRLLRRVPA